MHCLYGNAFFYCQINSFDVRKCKKSITINKNLSLNLT